MLRTKPWSSARAASALSRSTPSPAPLLFHTFIVLIPSKAMALYGDMILCPTNLCGFLETSFCGCHSWEMALASSAQRTRMLAQQHSPKQQNCRSRMATVDAETPQLRGKKPQRSGLALSTSKKKILQY